MASTRSAPSGPDQAAGAELGGDRVEVGLGGHRVGRVHLPPASDALPEGSRRASTRCSFRLACSLRALTASGLSFISRAAALRATCSDPQVRRRGGQDLVGVGGVGRA